MVFVILGVTVLSFYLSRGIPGIDPVAAYVTERTPDEVIEKLRIQLGLNQPLPIQYFYYLRDLISGNWGYSRSLTQPVVEALAQRFPATFELTMFAIILSVGIGVPLGIISAIKNNRAPDHASRLYALTGVSIPVFWFGLLLQIVFFYQFRQWGLPSLPSSGRFDAVLNLEHPIQHITGLAVLDSLITGNFIMTQDAIAHLILPAFALSFISTGVIARIMRSSMMEVLRQDYIIMARSKGLSERVVIYRHALKNALIPAVTVAGLIFGGLLSGAVLTETIFTWPGIGRLAATSIIRNDTALILGFVIIAAAIVVIANLLVDILYGYLDPRIKY